VFSLKLALLEKIAQRKAVQRYYRSWNLPLERHTLMKGEYGPMEESVYVLHQVCSY
jgi:hypothetical protein